MMARRTNEGLKIGSLVLKNNVLAAPMAGVTDRAFRDILRAAGAGLVFTEMLSDKALCYNNPNTCDLLDIEGELQPIAAQLCGSDPVFMARAARILVDKGVSLIDLNMGCPVPKVVRNKAGSFLLREPEEALRVAKAVITAVDVPVTVKMRLGWDASSVVAPQLARELQTAGVAAVTVHGRTREEFYGGSADWTAIAMVSSSVSIPVFGNGDIFSSDDAVNKLKTSGVCGVMLGRGLLGNPWLITQTVAALRGLDVPPPPAPALRIATALQHLYDEVRRRGEYRGLRVMRSHLAWYLKGLPHAAIMRQKINQTESLSVLENLLAEYIKTL